MVNRYICTSCGLFRRFDRPAWSIKTFGAALLALTAVVPAPHCPVAAKYPQEALLCLASLKEPDGELICPEHRNNYCMKEVSTLEKRDCGRTSYFGDKWNPQTNKCEYRKCDATCEESSWDFEFEGESYERNRFCCDFNYCNGATNYLPRPTLLAWITGAIVFALAQPYFRQHIPDTAQF